MRFLHDNKVMGAVLTPSSENANYPASNLKDPRLSRHLRFTSDSWQSLLIDSGGLLKDIFQATINLVINSEDPNMVGWTRDGCTVAPSGLYYDGKQFAKIIVSGTASALIYRDIEVTIATPSFQGIFRRGRSNITSLRIYDRTVITARGIINIYWATNVISVTGETTNLEYEWKDYDTVHVRATAAGVIPANDNEIVIYPDTTEAADDYIYVIALQAEDIVYSTPYVDGSRSAVSPDHVFEMPGMFIFKIKVRPWFAHDVTAQKRIYSWRFDADRKFILFYEPSGNKFWAYWKDGIAASYLDTEQFDDGTSYDDINSEIIFFGAVRLDQQAGQRFFVIVDGVKQAEDTSFSGVPDPKVSAFPTLSIGHEDSANHADSQFESVQFWAWDGSDLGTLFTEAAIDAAMAGKPTIFEQVYQPKIKANYAALAGHNLSPDVEIYLQGNDWNAWTGLSSIDRFFQVLTWDANVVLKNFTEKEYAFWRILIHNPNNTDGYVKLGLVYLGAHYEVEEFPDSDLLHKAIDTTKTSFSDSGQAYSRVGIQLKTYEISMGVLQEATRQGLLALYEAVGLHEPFFLLLDEDSQDKLPVLYCKLERGLTYRHAGGYLWRDKTMRFREVF